MLHLAIPTYRRPEALSRLLASLSADLRAAVESVTVFDDAAEDCRSGDGARYVGLAEKLRRIERIANAELRRTARFALFGMPELESVKADGMNRNAILLFNPGERILMADDDTVFNYCCFKNPDKIERMRSDSRLTEPAFFCTPKKSEKRVRDLLAHYEGNAFADFDAALGGDTLAAMAGVAGGRWYSSADAVLDTEAPLRTLMWKNAAEYEAAKKGDDTFSLLLSPETAVSPSAFLVAAHFAVDNSELLPPFLPHIRNDDGIWAMTLRGMYPASRTAYLPFAIEHLPVQRAVRSGGGKAAVTANGMIRSLFMTLFQKMHADAPPAFLRTLGNEIAALKNFSQGEWRDFCVDLRLSLASMEIIHFEKVMAEGRKPSFWAKDAEAHYEYLKTAPLQGEPWIPSEFSVFENGEQLFREYLDRCGELFSAWEEIRESGDE